MLISVLLINYIIGWVELFKIDITPRGKLCKFVCLVDFIYLQFMCELILFKQSVEWRLFDNSSHK